jgi:hypothetical protein
MLFPYNIARCCETALKCKSKQFFPVAKRSAPYFVYMAFKMHITKLIDEQVMQPSATAI